MADALDIEALWERAWAYCEERRDREYPLQPENWYAGICPDGRQLLAVFGDTNVAVCWLDSAGRHQGTEVLPHGLADPHAAYYQREEYPQPHEFLQGRFDYRGGPIRVRPFEDRSAGVAVRPLPHWLFRFVLDPYELEGDRLGRAAEDVTEWLARDDTYALEAWGNTFFIDSRDGRCTAS